MLSVEGVRAGYGRTEVLHGVDLKVPAGSVVALLGANGAGKTTLLRTVAGLIKPTAGQIRLRGARINGRAPHDQARAGLCLVPEGRAIFRQLSVGENLTMQARGRRARAAVEVATSAFPVLGRRLGQQAGTLSGGEQQMLALARAFVTDPEVILADELSIGLAPAVIEGIFDALAALRAEGRSLLIVDQYAERVLELADYVYILHKGVVVFVGEPAQCRDGRVVERYLGVTAA